MAENNDKVARGVFYAFTRVILVVVAVLVIALAFFTGMNSMNVNVITKDAFTMRAEYVLTPKSGQETDLPKIFTQDFIESDPVLNSSTYADYNVTSFYQRADVKAQIIWPWTDKAVVRATEEVLDILGALKENAEAAVSESAADAAAAGEDQTQVTLKDKNPPEWVSGEYEVTLIKDTDDSWKVQEMKLIREIKPVINAPSQEATESPSPEASAEGTASASAEATGGE